MRLATSTFTLLAVLASTLPGFAYDIHVKNKCHLSARVAVTYEDSNLGWRTTGWYRFAPSEAAYLSEKGKRLITENGNFYYAAEVIESSYRWYGDDGDEADRTYTIDGRKVRFRHIYDKRGDNNIILRCANIEPQRRTYEFNVKNECHTPVRMAVRYEDPLRGWKTKSWYHFEPEESAYLVSYENERLTSENGNFYYAAETIDTNYGWYGDDNDEADRTYTVKGREIRFRHIYDKRGNNDVRLTCANLDPPVKIGQNLNAYIHILESRRQKGISVSGDLQQLNWVSGVDMGGGGSLQSAYEIQAPSDNLSKEENKRFHQIIENEDLKESSAALAGLGAGLTCGLVVGVTLSPLAGSVAAAACNLLVNSATRTIWNCSVSKEYRSLVRRTTGRETKGCIEIGLGIKF